MLKIGFQLFAFLMELAMLAGIGFWGFQQGKTNLSRYGLAILLIAVAIVIWGTCMAPTSKFRLETNPRIFTESILFLITAFMIHKTGHTTAALIFAGCVILREIGAYFLKE